MYIFPFAHFLSSHFFKLFLPWAFFLHHHPRHEEPEDTEAHTRREHQLCSLWTSLSAHDVFSCACFIFRFLKTSRDSIAPSFPLLFSASSFSYFFCSSFYATNSNLPCFHFCEDFFNGLRHVDNGIITLTINPMALLQTID